jgi:hypothetical protein
MCSYDKIAAMIASTITLSVVITRIALSAPERSSATTASVAKRSR